MTGLSTRMNTESGPRGRNRLYIHVENGLCNRLRAYVSAKVLATKSDRDLVLIWIPDLHCEARFGDLFIENEEVIESRSELAGLDMSAMSAYNYMEHLGGVKEQPIDPDTPRDLYIRSAYSLRSAILNIAEENEVLRRLTFASEVQHLTDRFDVSEAIGVHVRRGGGAGFDDAPWDRSEHMSSQGKRLMDQYRSRTHPAAFMARIDDVLRAHPDQRFFLAADSQETYEAFLERYGEQTIAYLPRDRYDRSKQQQVYAMADLLLLSRTKQLLGSYWSAFSEVAARIGGQHLELVGSRPEAEPAGNAAPAITRALDRQPERGATANRSEAPADIPIVVIAHSRPASLRRLLGSLRRARLPHSVPLAISVDGGAGADHDEVVQMAEEFQWPFGDKEVVLQETNLGLRHHALQCGDLSQSHDGVLVLEDDLLVAPHFYSYGLQASAFYSNDASVAGISLYSHRYNETAASPFTPIIDRSDVYFMRVGASWGQIWLKSQWRGFREWLATGDHDAVSMALPPDVRRWPETSWKRLYVSYLIATNRFVVYPRASLTTNFGDAGVHVRQNTDVFQVPLQYEERAYTFIDRAESNAQYDAYCEILPDCLNRMTPSLREYDYVVDLYGTKPWPQSDEDGFVLTSRSCDRWELAFGRRLSPHETNVIEGIDGREIFLTSTKRAHARWNPGKLSDPSSAHRPNLSDGGEALTEPVPALPPDPSLYDRFYIWAKTRNPLIFSAGRLVMWCGRKFRRYPGWVGAYFGLVASLIIGGFLVGTPVGVLMWAAAALLAGSAVVVTATGYAGFLIKESDQRSWQQHDGLRRRVDAATDAMRSEHKEAMQESTALWGKLEAKTAELHAEQQTIKAEAKAGVGELESLQQQLDIWSRRVDAAMVAMRSEQNDLMQESTKAFEAMIAARIDELRAEQQSIKRELEAGIGELEPVWRQHDELRKRLDADVTSLRSEYEKMTQDSSKVLEAMIAARIDELRAEQQSIKQELEAGIGELERDLAVIESEITADDPRRRTTRRVLRLSTGSTLSVMPDDVFLASYPRSGNTWVRFLFANLRNWDEPATFDSIDDRIADVYVVSDRDLTRRPRPRILKIHEQFHPLYPRVIYLVRDPRDVARSYLSYLRMQDHIPDETSREGFLPDLAAFLPRFVEGRVPFGSWKDHVVGWIEGRAEGPDFLLIRYEDISENTHDALKRMAAFAGIPTADHIIDRAIELSSLDRMRALEQDYRARGGTNPNFTDTSHKDVDVPMALLEDHLGDVMKELGYL